MMMRKTLSASLAFAFILPLQAHAEAVSAWLTQIQQLTSTLKIATKQSEISKDKTVSARTGATNAYASTVIDTYNRESVKRTVDDFGPSGQLVDPCYQVGMAGTTTDIKGKTDVSAQRAMANLYATSDAGMLNSGGIAGAFGDTKKVAGYTYASSVSKRAERHMGRYCTVSEADAGYCMLQANGMQGADSDFSVHLAPGKTYGWDQVEAATDFVKTVAPVKPLPKSTDCNDPTCRSVAAQRRQQEVYMSMSRFSMMRFVESRSTQASGEAKKSGKES